MGKLRNNSKRRPFKLFGFFVKLGAASVIIFLANFFIISYIWRVLRHSDYFIIKEAVVRNAENVDLSYLKGKNIFSIDLRKESGYILNSFPEYANVKMAKVLPERVFADFIKRIPVAFIKLYRYFAVDDAGVIFYSQFQPEESGLPVIAGLETKIFGPKPGKKYNIKELSLALSVVRETKRNKMPESYKIKRIDVASMANASFLIEDREAKLLEVKLGADNIRYKIAMLGGLLAAARKDIGSIKYIDLRFKEPLIKFEDARTK